MELSTGAVTATAFHPYPTHALSGGGVEQDPGDWVTAARWALTGCAAAHSHIAALAITGQMQDLISLDADGRPLGRALLYSDTRAQDQAAEIGQVLPAWGRITGNEQNATSSAAMFLRLRQEDDPRANAAALLFSPAGYLVHRLGLGAHVDETTASTTGLLDLRTRAWSPEVCAAVNLSPTSLPEISSGIVGVTPADNVLDLPAGIPVVLAPGDAACTTLGIVGDEPGDDYLYLGSSGWHARVLLGTQTHADGSVHRLALSGGGLLQIAAVLSAGATAEWARGTFLAGASPQEVDRLLGQQVTRGFSGLLSLPSIHGERFPVRDDRLGAAVTGMTARTRAIDIYAAVLEGVALGLSHSMDPSDTDRPLAVVGGGTGSRPWMEIVADVTGREVLVIDDSDAALNGCALAAVAALDVADTGIVPLAHRPATGTTIWPDQDAHASYRGVRGRHRALYDALSPGHR